MWSAPVIRPRVKENPGQAWADKPTASSVTHAKWPARQWVEEFKVPLLAACWLVWYWAPWLPSGRVTAWLAAADWLATHGLRDLRTGCLYVTVAITFSACAGAACRIAGALDHRAHPWLKVAGLLLTCAPLCVLLPAAGAVCYLSALVVIAVVGWPRHSASRACTRAAEPLWQRLLRESFPVLAAACFLTMSWQYNAQWLTRGLLIAAGSALLMRATLPLSAGANS